MAAPADAPLSLEFTYWFPRPVIDVYDKLWGPCEMMAGHLSNFFFDLGEKYGIKFVRAQVNTVDELKEFKDQAEPHFLIYLVGAMPPRGLRPAAPG